MNRSRNLLPRVALAGVVTLSLAACGSDAPLAGPTSDETPGASCTEAAQEIVDAALEPIPAVTPSEAVDMSAVAGADVWAILALNNELIGNIGRGFTEAAKEAGMSPTIFDGKGTVEIWNQGIQQALAQGADAIQLVGVDPELVGRSLADAEEAGIPVISSNATGPNEPVPEGLTATLSHNDEQAGRTMGAYALLDSGCEGDLLYATSSLYHVLTLQAAGLEEQVSELCPDCVVESIDVDLTTAATRLNTQVSTALRRNPKIVYGVAAIDFMTPFMQTGMTQVDPELPLIASDGTTANLALVREGKQAADMAFPPNEFVGWLGIDAIGRILNDQEPDQMEFVSQLVTADNVGESLDDTFPNWVGYRQEYLDAWRP